MILLVLNAGSSSLKFAVWRGSRLVSRGQIEQIGRSTKLALDDQRRSVRARTIPAAVAIVAKILAKKNLRPTIIAHRIVHGGGWFTKPTRLTPAVIRRLRSIRYLAPLHLPVNLIGAAAAARRWPASVAWGVFDTAIFSSLPPSARVYALPWRITKKFGIRKYGFHGISHDWAFRQAAHRFKRIKLRRAVTIHLGAGDSMTRWKDGRPADTSMGFTPLEGLTMATRSGDLDPMIPLYLQTRGGFSVAQVATMLNRQSGLFGLTGLRDIRDVLDSAGHRVPGWSHRTWTARQRKKSKLALDIFRYDIQRYLSSYVGLARGLQSIIFTGPVGQNRTVQRLVLRGLVIPRRVTILTIPTDEETAIAAAVRRVIN